MKLFAIDFDQTIVNDHTHNKIFKAINNRGDVHISDENWYWNLVSHFQLIGTDQQWKKIFEDAINQGHFVSIVSFNAYGHIIPRFLEKIGLTKNTIQQIEIISNLPYNPTKANKNPFILKAIDKAKQKGFSGNKEDVILIDDSAKNITAAEDAGYITIRADKKGTHLDKIRKHIEVVNLRSANIINNVQVVPTIPPDPNRLLKPGRKIETEEPIFAEFKIEANGSRTIVYSDQSKNEVVIPPPDPFLRSKLLQRQANFFQTPGPLVDRARKPNQLIAYGDQPNNIVTYLPNPYSYPKPSQHQANFFQIPGPRIDRTRKPNQLKEEGLAVDYIQKPRPPRMG